MTPHKKAKLLRMAGNIAAGIAPVFISNVDKKREHITVVTAEVSLAIAEEIMRQVDEKYPDQVKRDRS